MKLQRALIRNFKGVRELEIDFSSPYEAEPRQLTCLLGDNGSGKMTILQAIALPLSLATRRTASPDQFDWAGFLAERVASLGSTRVELDVRFEPDEIGRARELFRIWLGIQSGLSRSGHSN